MDLHTSRLMSAARPNWYQHEPRTQERIEKRIRESMVDLRGR